MTVIKRKVLITGCSDGGLGSALALAFNEAGCHVYATARNPSKMTEVSSRGIETLQLDVLSESSIAACVERVTDLDILVNNAGAAYGMPMSDINIADAKHIFDLNVWSYIIVAQAFLPLLIKSKGLIVNHSSVASVSTLPFQSVYRASKAAAAMFSDAQRLELAPFGIAVVDLKTGPVRSNLATNQNAATPACLPKGSVSMPAQEAVEKSLRSEVIESMAVPSDQWARHVVQDLLRKKPPHKIWRGAGATLAWIATVLPYGMLDKQAKKMTGLDVFEQKLHG